MRGTRQGRTIELRLEGRLLCLWGLLGGEVSLEGGELSLLPVPDLGPQPSDPGCVLGPPESLCSVPVVLKVRRLTSQRSCQDLRQGDGRNESPVNGAGGRKGDRRVDKTAKDGQTDGRGKRRRGAMTDTLSGEDGWGPGRGSTSPPPPSISRSPPIPTGCGAPWGRAGYCTNYSTKGGVPVRQTRERGEDRAAMGRLPLALCLSRGSAWLQGRFRPGPSEFYSRPLLAQAPQSRGEAARARRGCSPRTPLGRARRHMMAQRLRRSAPWKRRAACTCLQRAQPTLLSSSLKSSRMCQLYLAEHST